jgi:hypothetical protein
MSTTSPQAIARPLTDQTPKEIDTQLAEIMGRLAAAKQTVVEIHARIASATKQRDKASTAYMVDSYSQVIAGAYAALPAATAAVEAIRAEAAPLDAEFNRRGGWTRAFLVTNTGGHVHNTMACGTCFITTQFAWLPEVSGDAEAEIVERAGEGACTVCYPSAPVNVLKRPNTFEAPDRKAARIERETKAAAKAAKAAATGITDLDGSPLRGRHNWVLKTERAAQIEVVDELAGAAWGYSVNEVIVARLTAAIAAKRGQSVEVTAAELAAKAAAKVKRENAAAGR